MSENPGKIPVWKGLILVILFALLCHWSGAGLFTEKNLKMNGCNLKNSLKCKRKSFSIHIHFLSSMLILVYFVTLFANSQVFSRVICSGCINKIPFLLWWSCFRSSSNNYRTPLRLFYVWQNVTQRRCGIWVFDINYIICKPPCFYSFCLKTTSTTYLLYKSNIYCICIYTLMCIYICIYLYIDLFFFTQFVL